MSKFPMYFLAILAIYFVVFLLGLGYFVIPAISFGLFTYAIFYFISMIIFLPLILFLLYLFDEKFPIFKEHELIIRIVITVFSLIAVAFFFFLVPF